MSNKNDELKAKAQALFDCLEVKRSATTMKDVTDVMYKTSISLFKPAAIYAPKQEDREKAVDALINVIESFYELNNAYFEVINEINDIVTVIRAKIAEEEHEEKTKEDDE